MRGARHRTSWAAALAGLASFSAFAMGPARASDAIPLHHTTFGTIGLIEMPSARMMPDGQLSVSASFFKNTQRYNFGFQALPWLEVAFRYTGLQHFSSNIKTDYDRSYAIKIRLFDEGEYRPAFVVGSTDLVGTGIYSSEYIAASKRFFDDFDATIGMGWGRLGSTAALPNPFGLISQSFKKRRPSTGFGGKVNLGQIFHGHDVGLFGGVVWRTPVKNLSLIAEYSSDRYSRETASGAFRPHTQLNIGANYQLFDSLQLGVDWLYGESIGVTLSFDIDPTKDIYPEHIAPKPVAPVIREPKQQLQAIEKLLDERQKPAGLAGRELWIRLPLAPPRDAAGRFVDGLMAASGGVRDVEFRGAKLVIATDRDGDTPETCRSYARLAATYLRDVRTVAVQGVSRSEVTCQILPQDVSMAAGPWQGTSLLGPVVAPVRTAGTLAPEDGSAAGDGGNFAATDSSALRAAETAIRRDATGQSIGIETLSLSATEATVYFRNTRYGSDAEAVGRLVRVLMKDAPADVEIFHLISMDGGIPMQEYQVLRSPMERAFAQHGGAAEIKQAFSVHYPEMDTPILDAGRAGTYPRFKWSVFPEVRESFFDPDKPVRFAVLAGLSGSMEVAPGLSLNAKLEANIFNDFRNGRLSNSVLPHVRSDFVQYYRHGANGIESLQASYRFRLAPSVFGLVKGGYLESMFGGVGGELLWRPENTRLALGVDLYEVWQRHFNRRFGFQSYHVLTGHVTIYYASPWYGLNFRVHTGRYLAGDRGATFEITRRFSTGVEIGAFSTFTNVPFEKFGEGSFDKGIVIRIPLDWALPVSTQSQFNIDLRPITRDGGQRLVGDATLYDETQRFSIDDLTDRWNEVTSPQ